MEDQTKRIEELEDTLRYIRWVWSNPYLHLVIDNALDDTKEDE